MAEHVVKNIALRANALNLSTYATTATFSLVADALDSTAMGDDCDRTFLPGLKQSTVNYGGWNDVISGDTLNALPGTANAVLLSFGPEPSAAVGTVGYITRGRVTSYEESANIGEIAPYTLQVQGTGFAARGEVFENVTRTATADGASSQLGAVSATQTLYASLHVTPTVSGTSPTLDVTIESDASGAFAGAETTRITFSQLTAEGFELGSVAGAVSDEYWRAVMTIGGSATPTFPIFIVLAIV